MGGSFTSLHGGTLPSYVLESDDKEINEWTEAIFPRVCFYLFFFYIFTNF